MELVRVRYHQDGDTWWAESDELPGWTAAGESWAEVHRLAHEGVHTFVGGDVLVVDAGIPLLQWSLTVWAPTGPSLAVAPILATGPRIQVAAAAS